MTVRQKAYYARKQKEGWGRVSALLEPEYVEMWARLAEKYGTKAEAMRRLAEADLKEK